MPRLISSLSPCRVASLLSLLVTVPAPARAEPKFEFARPEAVPAAVWKAQAQAGLIATTGNAHATTGSIGASASRKDVDNKFAVDVGGAYARSGVLVVNDLDGDGKVGPGEVHEESRTSTKNWAAKLRYDRFFTTNNSAFVTAAASGDEPAGKRLVGGGQAGYSRQLFHSDASNVVGEAGYDFAYERYVVSPDGTQIHSVRLFAGYDIKIGAETAFLVNLESLLNLNHENTPSGPIDAFADLRLLGKANATTKLHGNFSLRVGFTARYDHAPAPLPAVGGKAFAPGFVPVARTLDTLTEVSLIITLL